MEASAGTADSSFDSKLSDLGEGSIEASPFISASVNRYKL
jgi:hypothetical protein